jgi:uncharacterized membrane protein
MVRSVPITKWPAIFCMGLLIAAAALTTFSTPAMAELRVCNQSTNQVSIALGYRAEKGWQSEGWWVAPPQKCAVVYQGDLHSRFFYLYVADDIGGGAWDGTNFMCTRDEAFTIFGVGDCLARGYERTGFFEVDTKGLADWTLRLTDGAPELRQIRPTQRRTDNRRRMAAVRPMVERWTRYLHEASAAGAAAEPPCQLNGSGLVGKISALPGELLPH